MRHTLRQYLISIVLGFLVLFIGLSLTEYYAHLAGNDMDQLKRAVTLNTKIIHYINLIYLLTFIAFAYALLQSGLLLIRQNKENGIRNVALLSFALILAGAFGYRLVVIYPEDIKRAEALKAQLEQQHEDPLWKGFKEDKLH